MQTKKCSICGTEQPMENFYVKSNQCKDCMRIKRFNKRVRYAEVIAEILRDNPCTCCGEKDLRVLCFHHRNPEEKVMNISVMQSKLYSMDRLLAEIAKCDVLCANCHSKVTYDASNRYNIH